MKTMDGPFKDPAEKVPIAFLREMVGVFENKGWLNRSFRIMHREKKYRVFCSETQFLAHRISDPGDVPWGFPCWIVCLVTPDRIIEEPHLSPFVSAELSVSDWLRCFAEGDFTVI